jgi:lysophospholipase L1-like esterase
MIGTNDCNNNRINLMQFETNLNRLIDGIKDIGAIPVLHTPNTIDQKNAKSRSGLEEYVKVIINVTQKEKVILVDHWNVWSSVSQDIVLGKWLNDPIHPNGEGHVQIAQLMFKKLGIFDPSKPTCMNG